MLVAKNLLKPIDAYKVSIDESSVTSEAAGSTLKSSRGPTAQRTAGMPLRRLPPMVGRQVDLATVSGLVRQHSLVTIVGPGGIGKTALAASVAVALAKDGALEVAWTELAALADPALVLGAVAGTLGLEIGASARPLEALVAKLRHRSCLIVIDNGEHLIEAVAKLCDALIRFTAGIRVLVTSRAPLKAIGERSYRLGSLSVPTRQTQWHRASDFDAVALFVARVRASRPGFELDETSWPHVRDVCRRLEGIPLALELAAARVPSLGVKTLANLLETRLQLLTGGGGAAPARQQTIFATFNWSYDLLSIEARIVFRRLGAFAGGFTLDAARAVASGDIIDEWMVIEAVAALADASLIIADDNDPPRYSMLETGRAFALEKLDEAGEREVIERRHATYFCRLLDDAYRTWVAGPEIGWLTVAWPELANARAALRWAFGPAGNAMTALSLASSAMPLWLDLDAHDLSEGRQYATEAAALVTEQTTLDLQARMWFASGMLASSGRTDEELAAYRRSADLYRKLGDRAALCLALIKIAGLLAMKRAFDEADAAFAEANAMLSIDSTPKLRGLFDLHLAFHYQAKDDWAGAERLHRAASEWFEMGGNDALAILALDGRASAHWALGNLGPAAEGFRRAAEKTRRSNFSNHQQLGIPLGHLAEVLIEQDRLDEALSLAQEALPLLRNLEREWTCYESLAVRLVLIGRPIDAARLAGFAESRVIDWSIDRRPSRQRVRARLLRGLQLNEMSLSVTDALAQGAQLSDDDAYRIAWYG